MTATLKPTPARLALLQAVADGEVSVARQWGGGFEYRHRPAEGPNRTVTKAAETLKAAGWIGEGRADGPSMYARRPVELTDAGRTVLDNAKENQ